MLRTTFTYDGVRYYVRGHTQEELIEKKVRKQMELEEDKVKATNILCKDYAEQWYATYKEPYVGTKAQVMYKNQLRLMSEYIGSRRLKDITATDLQTIINKEYAKGRSKSHINKIYLTITQIFKRATIDRKISYDPSLALIKPKMEDGTVRALTDTERKAILEVAKTHKYGLWIKFMLYLGLRPIETASVKYEDIDQEHMFLYIPKGKTSKAKRRIPIPEPLQADIKQLSGNGYVFTTEQGNPLNEDKIRRRWNSFKRALDIHMGATVYRNKIIKSVLADDLKLYCLRHTYGTDGQAAGVPIDVLADLMGHEKIETTRKYYIDDNEESKLRARDSYNTHYSEKDQ